jgi:hypothetical protein
MPRTPASLPAVLLALAAVAGFAGAVSAATRDAPCAPTAVRVDEQKIEILCADTVVLNDRSQDRFREVERFAYPMVSQNFQPQLGSQVKLLDYYLEMAQNAVVNSRLLHVWFDSDHSRSQMYGCAPTNCRAIVALAITYEPIPAAPVAPEIDAVADQ